MCEGPTRRAEGVDREIEVVDAAIEERAAALAVGVEPGVRRPSFGHHMAPHHRPPTSSSARMAFAKRQPLLIEAAHETHLQRRAAVV